jgi:orotidine-5'-phosphate decarboxylase
MSFFRELEERSVRTQSRLCVGLDPDPARIAGTDIARFLREVIAATHDVVCCYKPNLAFIEAFGEEGWSILRRTLDGIPDGVPVIADAKRGDIGSTAEAYARALFEHWDFDAATVNAYGGEDTVQPFLAYGDRGVYVWCRSSNPGAADLQDLPVADGMGATRPLYEVLAERVRAWNSAGNAGLVAGATYPAQIARLRALCPELPFLVPGVGAQGAALTEAVRAAAMAGGGGFVVNASRGVLYASTGADFAEAARREALTLRDQINEALGLGV